MIRCGSSAIPWVCPPVPDDGAVDRHSAITTHALFVSTLNRARSVIAERLFHRHPGLQAASAGTSDRAVHRITADDLIWADLVIVFDAEHGHSIRQGFPGSLPTIVQAGIADEYPIDDPRYTPNCGQGFPSVAAYVNRHSRHPNLGLQNSIFNVRIPK